MNDKIIFYPSSDKLKEFGYPSELREVVTRFSKYVCEKFSDFSPGVLLVGSTARGELSWVESEGNIRLFSDVEFLVSVSAHNRKIENEFHELIKNLESEYDLGELFHIDYTVITWDKLPKLEKKFFIFESKQCGIDFTQKSVSAELPVVTRSNINWKELNEVLLHRLTSILHAIPVSFLTSTMTKEEKQTIGLNIAKNTLDITTWLHPYEAKELVAGFTARLALWDKNFLEQTELGRFFASDDIEYINSCLDLRSHPSTEIDITDMLTKTLSVYNKAISYCMVMNKIDRNNNIGNLMVSVSLFDEYNFKQRVSQIFFMLSNLTNFGVVKLLRNSIVVRKGSAVNICRYLLSSVLDSVVGKNAANVNLNNADYELSRLIKVTKTQESDFNKAWEDIRNCFKQYQDISRNS